MTTRVLFGLGAAVVMMRAPNPLAQERENRTLLSHEQTRAIVNEASGERAMHHVMELVPYPPLADVMTSLRAREQAGLIRLVER